MHIKIPRIKRRKRKKLKLQLSRISSWDVWMAFVSFFFVIPDGLISINEKMYTLLYVYGLYFAYLNVIIMFAFYIYSQKSISKRIIWFLLFFAGTVFILFKDGSSIGAWKNAISAGLFICIFAEANIKRIDKLVLSFLSILEFWIYLNLLLMLLFPNGMYYLETNHSYMNWILGYKSSLQYYVLPAICFSWINASYRGKKTRYLLLATVSIVEAIIANNIMLLIALSALLVVQFSRFWRIEKLFNIWIYYVIDLVINGLLLFAINTLAIMPGVASVLQYFGKNLTLTYRVSIIWPQTIRYIKNHLLFGNGFLTADERVMQYGGNLSFIHSHNELLEIFYIGGAFLFLLFLVLHIQIGRALNASKKFDSSKVLSVIILFLYIMVSVEVYNRIVGGPIWLMLYLAGSCNCLHNRFAAD